MAVSPYHLTEVHRRIELIRSHMAQLQASLPLTRTMLLEVMYMQLEASSVSLLALSYTLEAYIHSASMSVPEAIVANTRPPGGTCSGD